MGSEMCIRDRGQLVNGQLSERVAPRILLSIGMFCSALLNIIFGLSTGFYFLFSSGLPTATASRWDGHRVCGW